MILFFLILTMFSSYGMGSHLKKNVSVEEMRKNIIVNLKDIQTGVTTSFPIAAILHVNTQSNYTFYCLECVKKKYWKYHKEHLRDDHGLDISLTLKDDFLQQKHDTFRSARNALINRGLLAPQEIQNQNDTMRDNNLYLDTQLDSHLEIPENDNG